MTIDGVSFEMAEKSLNDIHRRTSADMSIPNTHERDRDRQWTSRPSSASGVDHPTSSSSLAYSENLLSLFRVLAAEDQDTHSISSTHVEAGDHISGAGDLSGPTRSMSGSGFLAVPGSRSITPMTPPGDQLLHGVGSCHDVRTRARLVQLGEVYNEYQERFVSFRKDQACGNPIGRAMSKTFRY